MRSRLSGKLIGPAGLALLIASWIGPAVAPAAGQVSPGDLDTLVPAMLRQYQVPGLALVIVRDDSVIALRGWGVARTRDGRPVDPERTIFRVASVAKLFVAATAMQQVVHGRLELDRDINTYLDPWQIDGEEPITLRHLLTHTAGFDERMIGYAARSRDEIGPLGDHLRTNLPRRGWRPGEISSYSNYGMALAAHLVERTAGTSFDRYARDHLFLPLGMSRTWYPQPPDSLADDRADGHRCNDEGCRAVPTVWSHPYPVGLGFSTAADMGRFLRAFTAGDTSALPNAARSPMIEQQFTNHPDLPGMSLGFFNQRWRDHRLVTHSGGVPGSSSLLVLSPDVRVGFFFVANGGRSALGPALRDSLLHRLLPVRSVARPQVTPLDDRHLERLAGSYQWTRYAHQTVERFPMLFPTSGTLAHREGGLELSLGGLSLRVIALDSTRFREPDGDRMLAFQFDQNGRPTRLFAPINAFGADFPGVLERRAWHDSSYFMNEYLSWIVAGPMLLLAAWPLMAAGAWLWRRRHPHPERGPRRARFVAWGSVAAFYGLSALFILGFVARSTRMMEQATGIVFGPTDDLRLLAVIPFALVALAAVVLVSTWRALSERWWDPARRSGYAAMAVVGLLVIGFLVRWNYLPVRFS